MIFFSKFNHYETSIHFNETQIETLSHFLNYKFKFDEIKFLIMRILLFI